MIMVYKINNLHIYNGMTMRTRFVNDLTYSSEDKSSHY